MRFTSQASRATMLAFFFLIVTNLSVSSSARDQQAESSNDVESRKQFLSEPDWQSLFSPSTPLLEIFIRGSVTYLGLFILLRLILKREAGTLGMTDLLVVVMLADAIQNGMAGNYTSITDGMLLVVTIVGWSHFLNFLGFHFPFIQKLVHPKPLLLVKDGMLIQRNLRKEFITEEELMTQAREQGISSLDEIRESYIEADGRISVLTYAERKNQVNKKKTV